MKQIRNFEKENQNNMIKKTVSVMLAIFFVIMPLTAFAFGTGETIHWISPFTDEGGDDMPVAGTLSTGDNACKINPSGDPCAYKFTAPESGVYAFSMSFGESEAYSYSNYCSDFVEGGNVFGYRSGGFAESFGEIYFFEENETQYFCIWAESEIEDFTVSLQYLGNVTGFCIAGEKESYQAGYEAFINELDEGKYSFSVYSGFTFTTDKGITFTDTALAIPFESGEFNSGENTVHADVYGFEKDLVFNIFYASDYIESVSPAEGFLPPVVSSSYDGYFNEIQIVPECGKLVFHMKDGSDIPVDFDASCSDIEIEVDGGKVITLYSNINMDDVENGVIIYGLTDGIEFFCVSEFSPEEEGFFARIFNAIKAFFAGIIMFFRSLFAGIAF